MFFQTVLVFAVVLVASFASPVAELVVVRDEVGNEFALLPIDGDTVLPLVNGGRIRRQAVKVDVDHPPSGGTRVSTEVSGPLLDKNGHRVEGRARWAGGAGPPSVGGGVRYEHDRGYAELDVTHTARGYGTDVAAKAGANIWRSPDRQSSLDVGAHYGQNFGGHFGQGGPQYGGFVNFRHRY